VIPNASLPQQRQAVTVLSDLSAMVEREGLGSPSVVVVGDVLQGLAQMKALPCENARLIEKNLEPSWTLNASTS